MAGAVGCTLHTAISNLYYRRRTGWWPTPVAAETSRDLAAEHVWLYGGQVRSSQFGLWGGPSRRLWSSTRSRVLHARAIARDETRSGGSPEPLDGVSRRSRHALDAVQAGHDRHRACQVPGVPSRKGPDSDSDSPFESLRFTLADVRSQVSHLPTLERRPEPGARWLSRGSIVRVPLHRREEISKFYIAKYNSSCVSTLTGMMQNIALVGPLPPVNAHVRGIRATDALSAGLPVVAGAGIPLYPGPVGGLCPSRSAFAAAACVRVWPWGRVRFARAPSSLARAVPFVPAGVSGGRPLEARGRMELVAARGATACFAGTVR